MLLFLPKAVGALGLVEDVGRELLALRHGHTRLGHISTVLRRDFGCVPETSAAHRDTTLAL
jgi:hypothetical protein